MRAKVLNQFESLEYDVITDLDNRTITIRFMATDYSRYTELISDLENAQKLCDRLNDAIAEIKLKL